MIQIRNGTFETNSSSTHAIVINTNSKDLPGHFYFGFGEFGWEASTDVPADDYLYTAIMNVYDKDEALAYCKYIEDTLAKHDVTCTFKEPEWGECEWGGRNHVYCTNCGYVDHCSELLELLNDMRNNEDLLIAYLSSADIATDNDNSQRDYNYAYDLVSKYEGLDGYAVYEKGN